MTSREAQQIFSDYLEQVRLGSTPDFEAVCTQHSAHSADLQALHEIWKRATHANSSFFMRLKDQHGKGVDPGISLDREPTAGATAKPADQTVELLDRVAAMAGSGRYTIKGELARGGMGLIYKVWDRDLRRSLAMKVVLGREGGARKGGSDGVDHERLSRFLEEAQITGQLDHPGIVPVHELGLDPEGRIFFTMRLVKGKELREIMSEYHAGSSGGSLTRAVQLIQKVCDAVAYAHEKGVIHRDLKPANVMVGRFGEVYVMDWGLAKVLGRAEPVSPEKSSAPDLTLVGGDRGSKDGQQTVEGAVFGTPSYMAPEQARGDLEQIGVWTDIYSVGSILYHLLTGRMPYSEPGALRSAVEVLSALVNSPPRPILECNPDVPGELVAICDKAMQREPSARYASLVEMRSELQAWVEGRVVKAYEAGALAEFRKWVKRNKTMAGTFGLFVLLAIGGASAFAWYQNRQAARLKDAQQGILEAKGVADENAEQARAQSYLANVMAADLHLRFQEAGEARRRLAACEPSLRQWEWNHVTLKADSSLATLNLGGSVSCVAATSDLGQVAIGSREDYVVRLWDPDNGKLTPWFTGHSGAVLALAFSRDGQRLLSGSEDGTARIWEVASGNTLQILRDPDPAAFVASVGAIAFDRMGRWVITGSGDWTVRVFDAERGSLIDRFVPGDQPVKAVAISPDGALIAAGTEDGRLTLYDVAKKRVRREVENAHGASLTSLDFSSDGQRLVSASMDGAVRVWSVDDGGPARELGSQGVPVLCAAFSPDDLQVATGSLDKVVRILEVDSGALLHIYNGHDGPVRSLAYGGSGDRLVTGSDDASVRLWSANTGAASTRFSVGEDSVSSVAIAPDSRRVAASAQYSGTIHVWDARSGERLLGPVELGDGVLCLCFSPDGERLVAGLEDSGSLRVLDSRTGAALLDPLRGHDGAVTAVAFSPDGQLIASASADGSLRRWGAQNGHPLSALGDEATPMTSVAFSPDGSSLAAGSIDGRLRSWHLADDSPGLDIQAHKETLQALAYSPSGKQIATASIDGTLSLWDAATGALVAEHLSPSSKVYSLAFNPQGTRLASALFNGTVALSEADSLEPLLFLRGHGRPVGTVAFSADGARLASGALDGSMVVWETESAASRYRVRQAQELVARLRTREPDLERVKASIEGNARLDADLRRESLEFVGLLRNPH